MMTLPDYWTEDDIKSYYSTGQCHIFAVAAAQQTQLPLGIMESNIDWHIEPYTDNGREYPGVPLVVHVYVDCGDGTILDVYGRRPIKEMMIQFAKYDYEACTCRQLSAEELNYLVCDAQALVQFDASELDEVDQLIEDWPALKEAVYEIKSSPAHQSSF